MDLNKWRDKDIYFVSDADLDGISTRIIFDYFVTPYTRKIKYYNTMDRTLPDFDWEKSKKTDIVIFADLTPPDMEFYNKVKENSECFIFDHHITAKTKLGELDNYYFDLDKCGTKLVYDFLSDSIRVKKIVKQYVDYVNTYDLWQTDSDLFSTAHDLHNIMYGYVDWSLANYQTETEKFNSFIITQLLKFNKYKDFHFIKSEIKMLERAKKSEHDNLRKAKKTFKIRVDSEGNSYGYFECTSKLSWISHLLLNEYQGKVSYLIGRSTYKKDSLKVSVRSKGEFDVSRLAEINGGGGHKNASGIDFSDKKRFDDLVAGTVHLV